MSSISEKLINKISSKDAKIGIIGMGYVGIPLGLEFANQGFTVLGFDKDEKRVEDINAGNKVMKHIKQEDMQNFIARKGRATTKFSKLADMNCLIICVPTPLDIHEQPDMNYVKAASNKISKNMRKGQLIILESTTYPGTTKELVKPTVKLPKHSLSNTNFNKKNNLSEKKTLFSIYFESLKKWLIKNYLRNNCVCFSLLQKNN